MKNKFGRLEMATFLYIRIYVIRGGAAHERMVQKKENRNASKQSTGKWPRKNTPVSKKYANMRGKLSALSR